MIPAEYRLWKLENLSMAIMRKFLSSASHQRSVDQHMMGINLIALDQLIAAIDWHEWGWDQHQCLRDTG